MAPSQSVRPGSSFRVRPLVVALVAAGLAAPLTTRAATIVVTDGGDAGSGTTCTLRQAVASIENAALQGACANIGAAFGSSDTVDLSTQAGVITLGGTEIAWAGQSIRFVGPAAGPSTLRVSGNGASRVFRQTLGTGITLIENLTIENGLSSGPGGCILANNLSLVDSIVTGCTATRGTQKYSIGWGGGVAGYSLTMNRSTIAANTAGDGGGGAFAKYAQVQQSTIANNTVAGSTCQRPDNSSESKYQCVIVSAGGGGLLVGAANLESTTVSGNTVNATFLDYTGNDPSVTDGHLGIGGGITVFGYKYEPNDVVGSKAVLKPTFAKARATLLATERGRQAVAAFEANAKSRERARATWKAAAAKNPATAPSLATKRQRAKVDGIQDYGLGLRASTISGNRVVGPNNPAVSGKYLGGGVASLIAVSAYGPGPGNKYYFNNDEIANSTISGNRLPFFPPPPDESPPPGTPIKGSVGGAILAGPVDISNSTITDNTSQLAGVAVLGLTSPNAQAAKSATMRSLFEPAWRWSGTAGAQRGVAKGARNKDFTPMVWESTIIANNPGTADIICSSAPGSCSLSGSNNLIRIPGMPVPGDTIVGVDPQLAPLANNGGTVAGAAGHATTGPLKTHALYVGSPALNTGNNLEGFEFDERGTGFPRVVGPAADIGAYEGSVSKPNPQPVPGLGPWALGLLSTLLAMVGLAGRRRRGSSIAREVTWTRAQTR